MKWSTLGEHGNDQRWNTPRNNLSTQRRITTTFQSTNDCTLQLRKAMWAEPEGLAIYRDLNLSPSWKGSSN
jgi:hypothetical protein